MTALYIICAAVLLLFLLLTTRGGAIAEYSEEGFSLSVRFGLIRVRVLPRPPKGKKKPPKPKKRKKPKPEAENGEKPKGGALEKLKALLPGILDFLGGFRRKLRVDELTVWYMAASEDPASAAMAFGKASAAMGVLTAALENALNVKKRDLRASVSFEETKPRVYLKAAASLRAGQALWLGLRLGVYVLKHRPVSTADKGKVDKNG